MDTRYRSKNKEDEFYLDNKLSFFSRAGVEIIRLPYLPLSVRPKALNSNTLRLLDKKENAQLRSQDLSEGVIYFPEETGLYIKTFKLSGDYFAICPDSTLGSVEPLQQQTSGKWYVLKKEFIDGSIKLENAMQEQRTLNELSMSPNITLKVRHSPKYKRPQYPILMELIEGLTIHEINKKELDLNEYAYLLNTLLSPLSRINILLEIGLAIQSFFNSGRIHPDINLKNIIVNLCQQKARLIDMAGVLKLENAHSVKGEAMGAGAFLAPELRKILREFNIQRLQNESFRCEFIYTEKTMMYAFGIVCAVLCNLFDSDECNDHHIIDTDASFVVSSSEEDLFEANNTFPKEYLSSILLVIQQMTRALPEERYTFNELISQLRLIKQRLLDQQYKLKVKPFDVKEIAHRQLLASEWEKLAMTLQDAEQIIMINTGARLTILDYMEIKQNLEKVNLVVRDEVYAGADKQKIEEEIIAKAETFPLPIEMCAMRSSLKMTNK